MAASVDYHVSLQEMACILANPLIDGTCYEVKSAAKDLVSVSQ